MKITILDKLFSGDPEAVAMLQAFYSRSKKPIADRLWELAGGSNQTDEERMARLKKSLNEYYVGYGHDSIGQVARMTLFIENVSLPAAKAIQHNSLYDGQESSTRYIEFGNGEPMVSPWGDTSQREWLAVYDTVRAHVRDWLVTANYDDYNRYPNKVMKSCESRAFDVARAFLPGGVTTNLSWHVSFANYNREIPRLLSHPLHEVRDIAAEMQAQVKEFYPAIYKDFDTVKSVEALLAFADPAHHYATYPDHIVDESGVQRHNTTRYIPLTEHDIRIPETPRAKYGRLPHEIHTAAFVRGEYWIDFASWRDVQRHRTLSPSPVKLDLIMWSSEPFTVDDLDMLFGKWYIDMLKQSGAFDKVAGKIVSLLNNQRHDTMITNWDDAAQYYLPIGLMVPFTLSGYLGDWLYVLELRSGETVHPTVRQWADEVWRDLEHKMRRAGDGVLLEWLKPNVKPYGEMDYTKISLKRADQDIVKKEQT